MSNFDRVPDAPWIGYHPEDWEEHILRAIHVEDLETNDDEEEDYDDED